MTSDMSLSKESSDDAIEDDFVILTPDPPAAVKDVLKGMKNKGVTQPTPPPPPPPPPLAPTAGQRIDARRPRGRLYLDEVSNATLRRSCLKCGNGTGSVDDSYVDLIEVGPKKIVLSFVSSSSV